MSSQITRCITSIPSCNPHFQTSLFAPTILQYVGSNCLQYVNESVFKDPIIRGRRNLEQIFKYFHLNGTSKKTTGILYIYVMRLCNMQVRMNRKGSKLNMGEGPDQVWTNFRRSPDNVGHSCRRF